MKREEFEKKSKEFEDFYLYYSREGDNKQTYLVGTTTFTTPYVSARVKKNKVELKDDEVLVWSWNSNKVRVLSLSKIRKLTPLAHVLKNNR